MSTTQGTRKSFTGYSFSRDFINYLTATTETIPDDMFILGTLAFGGCGCFATTNGSPSASGLTLGVK